MTKEEIDELEELLQQRDTTAIAQFLRNRGVYFDSISIREDGMNCLLPELTKMIESSSTEVIEFLKTKPAEFLSYFTEYFKDDGIIKYFVENREKYQFSGEMVASMLSHVSDSEYVRNILDHISDFTDIEFFPNDMNRIIINVRDIEYLKDRIENYEQYGLSELQLPALICATKDPEYIREKFENPDISILFDSGEISKMVIEIGDSELMKKVIEERKKYGLRASDIANIAANIEDSQYIKTMIENRGEYKFKPDQIEQLIIVAKDSTYTKQILENYQEYGLDALNITQLLISTEEPKYIAEVIQENKFGLSAEYIVKIIEASKDEILVDDVISNPAKYGLQESRIGYLIETKKNPKYIKQYIELRKTSKPVKSIKLPPNMTVGIEVECEYGINAIENLIPTDWEGKADGSLESGIEVISPILEGETHKADEIYEVCSLLQASNHEISERCGGHVHIGADFLTSVQSFRNLKDIWYSTEEILYLISNASGDLPRTGLKQYAPPISRKIDLALESGEIDFESEEELEKFVLDMQQIQGTDANGRYSGINFKNTLSATKNTIEFRLANRYIGSRCLG